VLQVLLRVLGLMMCTPAAWPCCQKVGPVMSGLLSASMLKSTRWGGHAVHHHKNLGSGQQLDFQLQLDTDHSTAVHGTAVILDCVVVQSKGLC